MIWDIPKMWDGGTCWIIGGGNSMPYQFDVPDSIIQDVCTGRAFPPAYSPFLKQIHKQHVIGVNNTYQIGAWIDAVFFGDSGWHLVHRQKFAQWPGLKITCAPKFGNRKKARMEGIKFVQKDTKHTKGISFNKNMVSWNGNSGAASISLAVHFGAVKIFLLGFDMMSSKYTHWHGGHSSGKARKRSYLRHLKGFPQIALDAATMGVKIYNVNMDSKIEDFPKITLQEALS